MTQAISLGGQPYTELPNAFKYRTAFDPACIAASAGQSWAEALGRTTRSSRATSW